MFLCYNQFCLNLQQLICSDKFAKIKSIEHDKNLHLQNLRKLTEPSAVGGGGRAGPNGIDAFSSSSGVVTLELPIEGSSLCATASMGIVPLEISTKYTETILLIFNILCFFFILETC